MHLYLRSMVIKHTHNIISPNGKEIENCVLVREWSIHLFKAYQCAIYSHYQHHVRFDIETGIQRLNLRNRVERADSGTSHTH